MAPKVKLEQGGYNAEVVHLNLNLEILDTDVR